MSVVASPVTAQPNSAPDKPGLLSLRAWGNWFAAEGQTLARALRSPALFALVVVTLLSLALAWQFGFSYKLDPHSDTYLDEPFYHGFNKVEEMRQGNSYLFTPDGKFIPYRWTTGDAYWLFPAVGQHAYNLRLNLAGGSNPQPDFELWVNNRLLTAAPAAAGLKTYEFAIPQSALAADGDLKIELKVKAFTPPKDARSLGLTFFGGDIQAVGSGLNIPPPAQLGWLLALILTVYLLLARSGFGDWTAAGGAGVVLAGLVWTLATGARPWLTIFAPQLIFAFGLAFLLLLLADLAMRRAWTDGLARRWVLAIFVGAFALRLAGLLHPQAFVTDIGFHIHRLEALWDRGIFFDKISSAEWGGRETVYPPTPYMFAGLLRWLIPDEKLLLEIFMVALDSSRVLLIYLLAQKTLNDRRAAILSAFFLATMPVGLLSVAWGQVANLFGEWLMLAVLTLLVVKFEQLRRPGYFVLTTFLLMLCFVSHPGVILLAGTVFLLLVVLLARQKGRRTFALIYVLALALSFGLYHQQTVGFMVPQALDTIEAKFSSSTVKTKPPQYQVGGSVPDTRLSQQYGLTQKTVYNRRDWLLGGLNGFWAEARTYFNALPLLVAPWFLWWLWHSSKESGAETAAAKPKGGRRRLFWAALAWFTTAGLFAIIGLTINLYVRYSLFLLPIAAIALAIFLAKLSKRFGWWGNVLTYAVAGYFLITALALYYDRIIYAAHPLR